MGIAELIADMRTRSGLSQAALAKRSGISRESINAYERGRRVPSALVLERLAEACGMELRAVPRPTLDLERNAAALEQALDLAELLPTKPRGKLEFPPLRKPEFPPQSKP